MGNCISLNTINYENKDDYNIFIQELKKKEKKYLKFNKRNIIEESYIHLIVENKIIIKKDIVKRIKVLYNHSNEKDSLKYLLMIINYLWIIKNKKIIKKFKKINCHNEFEKIILKNITNDYSFKVSIYNISRVLY